MSAQGYDHLVIGGGISGISAACYAKQAGQKTLLIEANERLGGCMNSQHFETLDGYWVEAGSHSCFNSYGNLLALMESHGLLEQITAKQKQGYKLWRGEQRHTIPSSLHFLELLVSLPRLPGLRKEELSVKEYYAVGLGRHNYRDVFGPAFRSVICQDPDDFPADALFRKKPRRKEVLRNFTLPEGLEEIPHRLTERGGFEVRQGTAATKIERDDLGYQVQLVDGSQITTSTLTLATPPDAASRLLAEVLPEAARQIDDIGVTEIDTLVLVFDKQILQLPEIAGLISVDGPFLSAVSRDFLEDARYRGFAFHFPAAGLFADGLSDDARIQAACRALDAHPDQVLAQKLVRNRLPSLRKGHGARIATLDRQLNGQGIGITGNWFLGVSIEDCVTRSREEAGRLFGHPA